MNQKTKLLVVKIRAIGLGEGDGGSGLTRTKGGKKLVMRQAASVKSIRTREYFVVGPGIVKPPAGELLFDFMLDRPFDSSSPRNLVSSLMVSRYKWITDSGHLNLQEELSN
ncbi:unnamed protein product [Dovyalis caffra]|uniref:Uncharacterized protein n=1 Tax=Dovyalis caffra TaxID=77055 RepID=A0AAV1SGI4_9ROSI|nr:unnamed protein product [Dovyalis caffra]